MPFYTIICMRTTLVLDDQLFKKARQRAAAQSMTLSDLVSQALRDMLAHRPDKTPPFRMVTFGDGAPPSHHEPADFADALEADDRRSVGR